MNLLDILIFAVGGLLSLFFYTKTKLKSAEALNTNLETNTKVQELQGDITHNNALIQAENENKPKPVDKTTLKDFFDEK